MRIIVIGGTGLAEQVADALHRAGDEVTVIDTEPGRESALAKACAPCTGTRWSRRPSRRPGR